MGKMTEEDAIKELERHEREFANDHGWANSTLDAIQMGIDALQKISCLIDKPCNTCKYNDYGYCIISNCIFNGKRNV